MTKTIDATSCAVRLTRKRRISVLILQVLFLFAFCCCPLFGSWRGTTGILEGRVRDKQTGELIPGVNIVVVGTPYGTVSDSTGEYRIGNVRPGAYDVRYSIVGYKALIIKEVTILPDLRTKQDVELEQSVVQAEAIEIRAEKPLIQTDQAATAFSVGEIKLAKLPVSKFQEILALQPGTTLEGNVRGGKTTEVTFLVDGLPVQDVIGGGLGTAVPKSSITNVSVQTGGFEAEYGNAMSGVVNVITKSGTNRHQLQVRYERDNWLPESWNQQVDKALEAEVTLGGPIVENQWYYFTANSIFATDTRWWQDFQHFWLSPVSQEASGFSKIEYVPSSITRLSLQGIYSLSKWHDYEFSWRFNLDGLPSRERRAYRGSLILSQSLSASTFLTASFSTFHLQSRIGDSKRDISLEPYEYDFYLRYIIDGQRNWWADTRQTIYTFKGDLTSEILNSHFFKVGVEFNQFNIFSDVIKYEPQTTYFGKPIQGAALLNYSNSYDYSPRSGSLYIQDKIELERDGSIFSLGARWDFLDPRAERPIVEFIPTNPNEYQEVIKGMAKARFKQQISPRVAFAAPVGPASFFFVNFGEYFQYPLFDYLYSGINPVQLRQGVKNVQAGNPDLEPERTVAWETGFKHSVNPNLVVSVTYFRKRFLNQIDAKTLVPFDSKYAGDYGFASYVNNADATSSGIELVLSRERDERISGTISYTYMSTEGLSEYVDQAINYSQWGFPLYPHPYPLSWDQRHTLKVDGDFKLIGDIQANVIVLYNSPRPFTFFPTRDGFTPSDTTKLFVPNNSRMFDLAFINVKLSKQFFLGGQNEYQFTIYADIRNLLNRKNVRWRDSSGRIGGELGDPGAYYEPRRVRLGMKLELWVFCFSVELLYFPHIARVVRITSLQK